MYTERIDAATVETGVLIGRTQLTHSSRFLRAETHFTPYQNIFHVLQNSSLQKLIQIGMKKKKNAPTRAKGIRNCSARIAKIVLGY